ncbi:5029_t:CDS:2 [Ambispora leptoticha]|uniref:5029_t:CDS:1 n=1 Tax=Ambispora leptoticha TaxID=144679 RepID=A0A9N8Z894_9GLOM|nr:5029_t:CDS:2 [Ambispora leptoticha]
MAFVDLQVLAELKELERAIVETGLNNTGISKELMHDGNITPVSQEDSNKLTNEMEINVLHHQTTINGSTAIDTITANNNSSDTAISLLIEPPTPTSDTMLSTSSFMTRISSPLKQSYIPEVILEESDDEELQNSNDEELLNNKKSSETRELKNKISFDDDFINQQIDKLQNQLKLSSAVPSDSVQIELASPELLSTNDQLHKENVVVESEDSLQPGLNESPPEPPNTEPQKSPLDPVDRLKEILLLQNSTSNSLDLPNLNVQQFTTPPIALEESNSNKNFSKLEQINEKDESSLSELSTTFLGVPLSTDINNTDIPLSKIFEDPVPSSNLEENKGDTFAMPDLINELSLIQNSVDGLSITDTSLDEHLNESKSIDQSTLSQNSEIDQKSFDNTSSTDSANSSKQNLDELSSLSVDSKSLSVNAESIKNRKVPVALDMSDIKNMKIRKHRINAYVQKTLSLNQEKTGLALWLCLNIKNDPSPLYDSLKSNRNRSSNSLSRKSSKSTTSSAPSSTPTAKVYSNPKASLSSLSQITTNSISLDNTPFVTPTSSLTTSSSKSSKSSKSSRTSLNISIQTSSLRLRPNSPPSSPRGKASPFLSLSALNRRGSFSKVTRPITFMPPSITNGPLSNSSSVSLQSIPKSPQSTSPTTPPKKQRRFSFQSVSSRFNFSSLNSSSSSFTTTIEESNDASAVEVDDNALDKLCDVLPNADRDILHKYLQKAGGKDDLMAVGLYMKDYKNGEIGKY